MALRDLTTKASGTLRFSIKASLVDNYRFRLVELVEESLTRWAACGWVRHSNCENDCNVQLYRFADQARRENPSLRLFRVELDAALPSKEMLQGTMSTKTMPRPDLKIRMGKTRVSVECKRLGTHGGHPREYVDNGIARFVTGNYAGSHGFGLMVGYVQKGSPVDLVCKINKRVRNHDDMGEDHCLSPQSPSRYKSTHNRSSGQQVRLEHFLPCLGPLSS